MRNPNVSILDCAIGRYMVYSTHDSLGAILLSQGVHEPSVLQLSELIVKNSSGKNILDIGANIGTYSIPMAVKFPEKNIYSFELQRNVYYQLCGNVFLNRIKNIHAINKGVSSTSGIIEVNTVDYEKCWNIGGYSIDKVAMQADRTDFPNDAISGVENAELIHLDNLIDQIKDVGLIKLDIEGHEIEALKGGMNFLSANGYPPIIFECWNFDWFAESKAKLFAFFNEIGYEDISPDIGYNNHLAQSKMSTHKAFKIQNNTAFVISG